MAAKRKAQKAGNGGNAAGSYMPHVKKVVWMEAACVLLIWLLFIVGLLLVFYLRGPMTTFSIATNMVLLAILFISLVPFVANWEYYSSIWKAWREGKEIVYREPDPKAPYSILGNREVWIKK